MSDFLPDPDYENDPSTITVEVLGEERPWYLGAQSFELAREQHGIEPGDILKESVAEDGTVADGIEAVTNLVWIGFLVFDEELTRRDVKRVLSFPPSPELIGPINEHMSRLNDEATDGIVGKATAGEDSLPSKITTDE
jgi:hypothetical protein